MKLLKVFSISFFVCFSFLFATPIFAEEIPTVESVAKEESNAVANINVYHTKVVSQKDNAINLYFEVVNGEGFQDSLTYSVSLQKDGNIINEYNYPEVFSISADSTIIKNITYTAPNLNGNYDIFLKIIDGNGSISGVGSTSLKLISSSNPIEILKDTCSLSVEGEASGLKYKLSDNVDIDPSENITLTCTAKNLSKKEIKVTPAFETHYASNSIEVISTEDLVVSSFSFKPIEEKIISFIIPKASKPQTYNVKVSLLSNGVSANFVDVSYIVRGLSATIGNFSLNNFTYKKGDTATLSLPWNLSNGLGVRSSDNNSVLPTVFLYTSIVDSTNQQECITPFSQSIDYQLSSGMYTIPLSIISDCNNPQVKLEIKDSSSNILDSKELVITADSIFSSLATSTPSNTMNYILIVIGVLVVAGATVYIIKLKRK